MNEKIKTKEKVFYGLGDLGNNIAYGAVGFYLVFFLTDVAGMNPVYAGYIFMVERIWNAFTDLIMGVVSDHARSRWGRRRPFLLFGAIPLGIGFMLLWVVPFQQTLYQVIYFTLIGILFNTLYSLVSIPYNSLLPELSRDPDERTSISGFKMALSFIGSLLSAMGVTLIVDILYPGKEAYTRSFPVMGRILGLILILCILLAFAGTKERVIPEKEEKQERIGKTILALLKLKAYRKILAMFICNMVAFDIIMAIYIYYMKYSLAISEDLTTVFMAVPLITAVAATPLWVGLSNKIGKIRTYEVSTVYFLVPLVLCLFIPAGNLLAVTIVTILVGVGISAGQTLIWAILPDVVEVDEEKNGVRREGIIYGITMFLYKICSAICVGVATAALKWVGYVESTGDQIVTQSAGALQGIRYLMGCLPAAFLLLSIYALIGMKDKRKGAEPNA
ncbi:MAG: MFS transporter [Lachnospiraceae bacterium]|nr:MFS transporter [Lachnospiraceae bacterium]